MKRWCRHILKNPTRYFMLFYAMLIWRVLAVYFGITALNLLMIFLLSSACYLLYGAIHNLAVRRKVFWSLVLLFICLPLLNLLDTHIVYALYQTEGIHWITVPPVLAALFPVLLCACLFIQDRFFHPLGAVIAFPFVILSWITLIQNELKVWIILYLFLALIEISLWIHTRARRRSRCQGLVTIPRKRMMITAALVFVFCTPALFFPLSSFGTRNLRDIIDSDRVPSHYITGFNLHSLGYGDEATLGGPIELEDDALMTVEADAPLYLRGNVKDLYTGHAWQKTDSDIDRLGDYAVHEVDKDSPHYLAGVESNLRIYPVSDTSKVLFTPLHATYIFTDAKVGYGPYYIFYNIGRRHNTTPYTVTYKDISFEASYDYPYDKIKGRYDQYLQLPDTITPETIDLVNGIIRDARTTSEKVQAIRQYLADNCTYTTIVGPVPADADFVDHFLFRDKKGYCTYFATSAAVMCRIAGVPARYVQGFKINPDKRDPDGRYLLTGWQAHAWIEVLVSPQDRLWATVESTPGLDTQAGSAGILPESTPPPFGQPVAVPLEIPSSATGANTGFIGKHLLLFVLILLLSVGVLGLAGLWMYRYIKKKNNIFTCPSILPLYGQVREMLVPAGIFSDNTRSDLEEIDTIGDGTLKAYLLPLVSQYYDEFYGGIQRDSGIDRRSAYRYIVRYVRRYKRMRKPGQS